MRYLLKIISILLFAVNSYAQFIPFPFTSHSTGTRAAQTFYVKSSGSDAATGLDTTNAWQTIDKINTTRFIPGDTIKFKGGNTFTGTISMSDSGSITAPIVITSYGGSRAKINTNAKDTAGIIFTNKGNITIRSLNFTGIFNPYAQTIADSNGNYSLIHFWNLGNGKKKNITIDSCNASRNRGGGIYFASYNPDTTVQGGFENVFISNCNIDSVGHLGVAASFHTWKKLPYGYGEFPNKNFNIRNVTVSRATGITNLKANGVPQTYTGNGIALYSTDSSLVERCLVRDCGALAFGLGSGASCFEHANTNRITLQYNEGYNQSSGGYDAGGIHFDNACTNNLAQYNYMHNNNGTGIGCYDYQTLGVGIVYRADSNNVFRYNILENNCRGTLGTGGAEIASASDQRATVKDMQVYHNIIYTTSPNPGVINSGISAIPFSTNTTFRNNIIITGDTSSFLVTIGAIGITNVQLQNNIYWNTSGRCRIRDQSAEFSSINTWASAKSRELLNGVIVGKFCNPFLNRPGLQGTNGNPYALDTMTAYKNTGASIAIDFGINLDSIYGTNIGLVDFYGNPNKDNGRYDIGAYENLNSYRWQDTTKLFLGKSITPPSIARQYIYDTLYMKLQTDSILRDARILNIYATSDTNLALRNLKIDSIQAIRNGTMTFMVDSGFYGNGTTGLIKTQVNASTQSYGIYSVNDISTGLYVISNVGESAVDIGCWATNYIYYNIRSAGNKNAWYLNSTTTPSNTITDSRALWILNRNGSTTSQLYKNGTSAFTSTVVSTAIPNNNIYIGAISYNSGSTFTSYSTRKYSAYWLGRNLSAYRQGKLSEHINWYMTRLGINQY